MDIRKIDKNFDISFSVPEDIEWISLEEIPFAVYGVTYSNEEGLYRRLPKEIAESINEGVAELSKHTAGGRIRFVTDSPYLAVRVEEPFGIPCPHMTVAGERGVSVFTDQQFIRTLMPSYDDLVKADKRYGGEGKVFFGGVVRPFLSSQKTYKAELFLPLYSEVHSLYIGVKKGSILQECEGYKHKKPILFYGSSITQGACASKPGDDYINRLSRMLDTDYINLGFSGSAMAEQSMAEYIASINPSAFVLDYDHNAPTPEHLRKTHYPLYETVRKSHPTTPIIFTTMPTIENYEERPWFQARRKEILESFSKMKALGDENVYFIDFYGCYGALENGECGTVDNCHPNSLGFLRMAEKMYPLLDKLLND